MVMIVKNHEKKALGFISVTWATTRAHVSALPGPHRGMAIVYRPVAPAKLGWPASAVARAGLPQWKEEASSRDGVAGDA